MTKRPFSKSSDISSSVQAAFDYHVMPEPNSGCHLWIGPTFKARGGYGCFTMRSAGIIQERAHRVAWKLRHGSIESDVHILHRCDNTACVNVDHLFRGDQQVNMEDKVMKDRQNKGDNHGMSKLTEADAICIIADKRKQKLIAEEYGVSVSTVCDIKRGRSWMHLPRP